MLEDENILKFFSSFLYYTCQTNKQNKMNISLSQLIQTLINGNDYDNGTTITINRDELIYDESLSVYNNAYFKHQPTGSYLYVEYTDDENFVSIHVILPNESPIDDCWKHHLADDFGDDMIWDKLDDDYESTEFDVEYKYEIC